MAKLTKQQIREIVTRFRAGESPAQIAREHSIHPSTIYFHDEKTQTADIYDGGSVYSIIKTETQYVCIHPSTKCLVCGKLEDVILRNL